MTPDVSQWRSTERYDYVEQLMSPELAWEWLRRNQTYQRDYADVVETAGASQPLNEAAQQRWKALCGAQHTFYCGAYWANGFHEDGVVSALRVAQAFGERL